MAAQNVTTLATSNLFVQKLVDEIEAQLNRANAVAFAGFSLIDKAEDRADPTSRALFETIEEVTESRAALFELRRVLNELVPPKQSAVSEVGFEKTAGGWRPRAAIAS